MAEERERPRAARGGRRDGGCAPRDTPRQPCEVQHPSEEATQERHETLGQRQAANVRLGVAPRLAGATRQPRAHATGAREEPASRGCGTLFCRVEHAQPDLLGTGEVAGSQQLERRLHLGHAHLVQAARRGRRAEERERSERQHGHGDERERQEHGQQRGALGGKGGSGFGRLALRKLAPEQASGHSKLRPASANPPLGPRWPATSGVCSARVLAEKRSFSHLSHLRPSQGIEGRNAAAARGGGRLSTRMVSSRRHCARRRSPRGRCRPLVRIFGRGENRARARIHAAHSRGQRPSSLLDARIHLNPSSPLLKQFNKSSWCEEIHSLHRWSGAAPSRTACAVARAQRASACGPRRGLGLLRAAGDPDAPRSPAQTTNAVLCVLGSRCLFGRMAAVGRGWGEVRRPGSLRRTRCGGRRGAALPDPPSCRFLDCHNPTKEGLYELKQLENPARCVEEHAHAHAPGSASASSPSPSGGAVTFGATMLMGCRFTSPIGVPAGSSVTDRSGASGGAESRHSKAGAAVEAPMRPEAALLPMRPEPRRGSTPAAVLESNTTRTPACGHAAALRRRSYREIVSSCSPGVLATRALPPTSLSAGSAGAASSVTSKACSSCPSCSSRSS
eukprot:scaffold90790_cov75-Phaeocystis_antarctica.AAC.2